jgi:hypothetical protein
MTIDSLTPIGDQFGYTCFRRAATPEICGVAIEVLQNAALELTGTEDIILIPGADTSGSDISNGIGPLGEKTATEELEIDYP